VALALKEANDVMLAAKHTGPLATSRALVRLGGRAVLGGAGAVAWWRPATRRASSAAFLGQHWRALRLVARRRSMLLQMLRWRGCLSAPRPGRPAAS